MWFLHLLTSWGLLHSPTSVTLTAAQVSAAQDPATRAHVIVDRLASREFMGRGYLWDGDGKAARFLQAEFARIGLQSVSPDYGQEFSMPVNTFPWEPVLSLDGRSLELGVEFIPSPGAPSVAVDGEILRVDGSVFSDDQSLQRFLALDLRGKVLVYDQAYDSRSFVAPPGWADKVKEAVAVIVATDSLVFSVARTQAQQPKFQVLKSVLSAHADGSTVHLEVQSRFEPDHRAQNVIGVVRGTESPERYLVISAHYDHLGAIGPRVYFPGANDNASGVAMMLELAEYFATHPQKFSVMFIGFAAEEAGLVGSKYYVEHPLVPLSQIGFLMNLDLFATGEQGMTAVNATVFPDAFQLLTGTNSRIQALPAIAPRGKAANSDHYWFSEAGVPAFFFYLMGASWTEYHNIRDTAAVPLTRFNDAYRLMQEFALRVMETPTAKGIRHHRDVRSER